MTDEPRTEELAALAAAEVLLRAKSGPYNYADAKQHRELERAIATWDRWLDHRRLASRPAVGEEGLDPWASTGDGLTPNQRLSLAHSTGIEVGRAEAGELLIIVKRTASMGSCSQTHHEHLALDARAALADKGSQSLAQQRGYSADCNDPRHPFDGADCEDR